MLASPSTTTLTIGHQAGWKRKPVNGIATIAPTSHASMSRSDAVTT